MDYNKQLMYDEKINMLSARYEEVNGYDFYKYIFPNNEISGEQYSDFSHPNAIYLYHDDDNEPLESDSKKRKMNRRIMLSDTWEDDYCNNIENNELALCSGLAYRGYSNKFDHAQTMNAMIFDLDLVGGKQLDILIQRMFNGGTDKTPRQGIPGNLPTPTFIVVSGTGVHVYYVFKEPIPLFPNIKLQLKELKHYLTERMWDYKGTTLAETIQYQPINQAFRMIGSVNGKYGYEVRAFKIGDKVTIEDLNVFGSIRGINVDLMKRFGDSKCSLAAAKESYPEWYERVVIKGQKNKKKWDIGYRKKLKIKDDALYQWWLNRVGDALPGHRYHFMLCTVIYACKNGVPKAKVKADLEEKFSELKSIKHENELTMQDLRDALEIYNKEYYTYPIKSIERLSGLAIERNRRNGRKQDIHLGRVRAMQNFEDPNGFWRNKEGAPSKKDLVKQWRLEHPNGKKADCNKDTGIDPKTIRKWWEV